jgi:hypothetical protein
MTRIGTLQCEGIRSYGIRGALLPIAAPWRQSHDTFIMQLPAVPGERRFGVRLWLRGPPQRRKEDERW